MKCLHKHIARLAAALCLLPVSCVKEMPFQEEGPSGALYLQPGAVELTTKTAGDDDRGENALGTYLDVFFTGNGHTFWKEYHLTDRSFASAKGEPRYHPPSHGMTRPGTPQQGLWSHQSPLVPTPGDRGLDAENSEGSPVPRQTAPGAQAADGPSPRGAVSTRGKRVPKEEPWGDMARASRWGRHQARGRGGLMAEACGPS